MTCILNFGSINVDHVYHVEHFVQPGGTLTAQSYEKGLGGKGLNQSVALLRAGAEVIHLGSVNIEDYWVRAKVRAAGLDMANVTLVDADTGHACIQVNAEGENCILLHPGANRTLTVARVKAALLAPKVDWVLLQNETNLVDEIIQLAHAAGKKVVFNPAPCTAELLQSPLHLVHTIILNEVEALQLTGISDPLQACLALSKTVENVVLTLGNQGAQYCGVAGQHFQAAQAVSALDTTAAGDTFVGYYLAAISRGVDAMVALHQASAAAAWSVQRRGAADSIPYAEDLVKNFEQIL